MENQGVLSSLDNLRYVNLFNVNTVDFSIFANMKSLESLNVSGLTNIANIASLNNLNGTGGRSNIKWIELSFKEKSEIAKLEALTDHEDLLLIVGLENPNYNVPIPAEDISDVVEYIETFEVSQVLFKDIVQDYHPEAYSPDGGTIEITLNEISPWINYIRNNNESNLYFPGVEIERFLPGEIDIEYDEQEEKIIINPDSEHTGTFRVDFDIVYHTGEYSTYRVGFSVYIKIMTEGRVDFEVNVPDPNLRQLLMDEYNFDGNEMISEYDMFNIEDLETDFTEISDLTGLEYAINLTELHMNNTHITDFSPLANLNKLRSISIANYQVEGEEDFSAFANLPALENFWLGTNSSFDLQILQNNTELHNVSLQAERVDNVQSLNNLPYLNSVHLTVNSINGLDGLEELSITEENSRVEIEINNYNQEEPFTELEYNNILTAIKSLKTAGVNKVKLNVNQAVVDLGEILVSDEPFTLNFEDINPFVNALVNEESPLYRPNVSLYKTDRHFYNTNNEDLTVDTEHKQLIFNITNVGENFVVVQLGNEDMWQDTNDQVEINCTIIIKYNTIVDGDKTRIYDENDIPDEDFRRHLEEDYNADNEPGISEYDMKNISKLYLYDVRNLKGIEYATNLKELEIDAYESNDLSILQNLTKLEKLQIGINDSKVNLTPIAGIPNLKELEIYYYGFDDEINVNTIVHNMLNLEKLSIQFGQPSIAGITGLANLKELDICMPANGDISPIASCTNLERLTLRDISTPIDYNMFNTLPINNLSLEFSSAQAIVGLNGGIEVLDSTKFFTNLNYNSHESITAEDETIFLNEINKTIGKTGFYIDFSIEIDVPNISKNTTRVSTYQEFDKILGATLDSESRLYNVSARTYGGYKSYLTVDDNAHTVTISAGDEIGDTSTTIYLSGNNIYGNIRAKYKIITDEGNAEKIYDATDIPDGHLLYVLEERYNVDGEPGFSERDMLNLTELDLFDADIEDLTGIEEATNLKEVYAGGNKIRSIAPLMEIEGIDFIDVNNNYITDITCLNNRKADMLRYINLAGNFIDLSNGSANLEALEEFFYLDDNITNIQMINTITAQKVGDPDHFDDEVTFGDPNVEARLIELGVETNERGKMTRRTIYDATVEHYTGAGWGMGAGPSEPILRRLNLEDMEISDLSGFEYLGQIEELILRHNNITDITPLKYLAGLKDLDLSENNISDLSPLSIYIGSDNPDDEERIINFRFAFNNISDVSPISSWKIVTSTFDSIYYESASTYRRVSIDLAENNISSIAGVENWKNLCWLDLASNKISDITNLKNYNFTVWPNAEEVREDATYVEQLDRFSGIQLINQNPALDLNAQGTIDAKAVFVAKNVPLILEEEPGPNPDLKLGDVNGDGEIDPTDAKLILRYFVGKTELTPEQLILADVNHDDEVDPTDAKMILRYYVGKIENFD